MTATGVDYAASPAQLRKRAGQLEAEAARAGLLPLRLREAAAVHRALATIRDAQTGVRARIAAAAKDAHRCEAELDRLGGPEREAAERDAHARQVAQRAQDAERHAQADGADPGRLAELRTAVLAAQQVAAGTRYAQLQAQEARQTARLALESAQARLRELRDRAAELERRAQEPLHADLDSDEDRFARLRLTWPQTAAGHATGEHPLDERDLAICRTLALATLNQLGIDYSHALREAREAGERDAAVPRTLNITGAAKLLTGG